MCRDGDVMSLFGSKPLNDVQKTLLRIYICRRSRPVSFHDTYSQTQFDGPVCVGEAPRPAARQRAPSLG